MVTDWNPGTQMVRLEKKDGDIYEKQAKDCTPDEKFWYVQTSSAAQEFLKDAPSQKAKTLAMLNGEKFYMYQGAKVPLHPRDKTEWVKTITEELASLRGDIGNALLGGMAVGTQYVANVLSNIADGIYFDSAYAEMRAKWEKEKRRDFNAQMQTVLIILVFLGGLAFIFYLMTHNGL